MFEDVGLGSEEERAYRFLVQEGQARAGDLAARLGLDESESQRLLDALTKTGLVTQSGGDGGPSTVGPPGDDPVFRPLSPDLALGSALQRRQESLETARREVAKLTEEYLVAARRHDVVAQTQLIGDDGRHRLDRTRLATAGNPAFQVSGSEVEYVLTMPGEGGETEVFFSDLTHDYVTLNAEYST
jgi:DNA-binding transcriptional ArsR family regulator